jgi:hypothetical protein
VAWANLRKPRQYLLSDSWSAAFTPTQPNTDINIGGIVINRAGITITIIIKPQNFQYADFWHSGLCWGLDLSGSGLVLFG